MKQKSILIGVVILLLLIMFGFMSNVFRRGSADDGKPSNIVLGMVLLNDVQKIDFKRIADDLKNKYGLAIISQKDNDGSGVIELKNSLIGLAVIDLPIPVGDLEYPSQMSYLWPEAKDLIPKHKAHIIVSVASQEDTKLNMYKTFTKAAGAILANTNSMGIYLGSQTLVLSKDFYLEGAESLTDEDLPLLNWIYFGHREKSGKHSGYTFGLKEFGFKEVEIIDSSHSAEEIQEMLFNISHYVIQGDVTLQDGETIGLTEDQKIKIVQSKGVLVEGTTLKLKY